MTTPAPITPLHTAKNGDTAGPAHQPAALGQALPGFENWQALTPAQKASQVKRMFSHIRPDGNRRPDGVTTVKHKLASLPESARPVMAEIILIVLQMDCQKRRYARRIARRRL